MIIVLGRLDIEAARLAGLKPAFQQMMRRTRAEAGCCSFSIAIEDEGDADRHATVRLAERWESAARLKEHAGSPHMAEFRRALQGAVHGQQLQLFDAANERPLELH